MDIIKQCQRVALKCRKLENKRVEILQCSAEEIDRLSKQIECIKQAQNINILEWTKSFKRSIDKFKIQNYEIDYDATLYFLEYDEYYSTQSVDVHLKSFQSYNKLLTQHQTLTKSNKLLVKSLRNELNRLQNILRTLTKNVKFSFTQHSISYSKTIVSGYIRSYNLPQNIFFDIWRYFRLIEFYALNCYDNDRNDDGSKYENLFLQNTKINKRGNVAIFEGNKSELIVIDKLLSCEDVDIVQFKLKVYGKPAIGFMKESVWRKRNEKKNVFNESEYVLVNGQQSAMLSDTNYDDDIPLIHDPNNLFKYALNAQHKGTIFHGINDCLIKVDMLKKKAMIKIKSVSNKHKEIEYQFYNIPDRIYCVARVNSLMNKIEIIQ